MKKFKYLILLLLLLPITVFAKTPNKEETIKVIENIENVQVDDGIIIYSAKVEDRVITININDNGITAIKKLNYYFDDNGLTFYGGEFIKDSEFIEIDSNDYAFYLYSILENLSAAPYDQNNYYNRTNIINKINGLQENEGTYIDDSKTFGLTIKRKTSVSPEHFSIIYHYYFTGDYPVMVKEEVSDTFTNPNTGNYTYVITIMLIATLCIGIYTYLDASNKRIKGENL